MEALFVGIAGIVAVIALLWLIERLTPARLVRVIEKHADAAFQYTVGGLFLLLVAWLVGVCILDSLRLR